MATIRPNAEPAATVVQVGDIFLIDGGTGVRALAATSVLVKDANGNVAANNIVEGYATTATAAGTTTLTVASAKQQFFTGTTTQTVVLPVTSTLPALGHTFFIQNSSTGAVTIQSSGGNTVAVLAAGTAASIRCVALTGTSAASWQAGYSGSSIASGKVFTVSNSLTFAGTDGTTMTFPNASDTVVTLTATQTLTNKTLTAPAIGAATGTSLVLTGGGISFATSGQGHVGTTTNDNANAGVVGEYIESIIATGSALSLTTATAKTITSISLTAGDWEVSGNVSFNGSGGVSITVVEASISLTTNTVDQTAGRNSQLNQAANVPGTSPSHSLPVGPVRLSLSGTTTVFIVANSTFTIGTLAGYGIIHARRVR